MIKQLLIYCIAFALLFFAVLHFQNWLLKYNNQTLRFNFYDTNLFFAVSSALICIHLLFFSKIKTLQPQVGYIYLPTLFIKGIIFFLAFKSSIFSLSELQLVERLNLLLPLFVFLVLEVFFVIKILKQIPPKI